MQEPRPATTHKRQPVAPAKITLTFSLPSNFGVGWGYTNVRLYGANHAWAGSYDKSENGNFAHEVLMQLPEVTSACLEAGSTCSVDVEISTLAEATAIHHHLQAIQSRLQVVVDAFAALPERHISVRGSNFYDSKVTEYGMNDSEIAVVSDMPYLNYLAKCVPLAEYLPALSGHDLALLRAQADELQLADTGM